MDSFPTASSISTDSSNKIKMQLVIKSIKLEVPSQSCSQAGSEQNVFSLTT